MQAKDEAILVIVLVKAWLERDGRFLLARRSATELQAPSAWALPGGKVEPRECRGILMEELRREVQEEVGLEIEGDGRLVYDNCFLRADGAFVVGLTFLCRVKDGDAQALSDTTRVDWFDLQELASFDEAEPWLRIEIDRLLMHYSRFDAC